MNAYWMHGADVHAELARLFGRDGWTIIFDYAPNSQFETPLVRFSTNDGVLCERQSVKQVGAGQ